MCKYAKARMWKFEKAYAELRLWKMLSIWCEGAGANLTLSACGCPDLTATNMYFKSFLFLKPYFYQNRDARSLVLAARDETIPREVEFQLPLVSTATTCTVVVILLAAGLGLELQQGSHSDLWLFWYELYKFCLLRSYAGLMQQFVYQSKWIKNPWI